MKLAYVTTYNAEDVANWSGTGFHILQALRKQSLQVELIGSIKNKYSPVSLASKGREYLYKWLFKQKYLCDREPLLLKQYAKKTVQHLAELKDVDLVFSPGTMHIGHLECDRPIGFWTDATFASLVDFYPQYSNLCEESLKNGHLMEQQTLDRCKIAIYSSEWSAQSAINNYQIDPAKVKVVPFGANVNHHKNFKEIQSLIQSRPTNQCKLLFLGVDWYRKGGQIAFEVAKALNQSGLPTELTVVGCEPILDEPIPDFVKYLGFISKATTKGREKLNQIIAQSHFLILPAIADCTPIVFCEANSFGVPCLSIKVGGIPTVIKDNINGKLFAQEAEISEYCQYIANLLTNYPQYQQLAYSAFHEYETRLNWTVAARTVKRLLQEAI
ncbi:glycosyl transferase group 1 [Stanieria cyanosphaera PCC 7437]|uniref:Glycosyl transferase group 1 n=2 Tax=Stanieria cyanosphaera TaxID=102116 RepID=K9XR67_STAC7|nr:glycosyl transferase group 1 [Stanieria cyanosphaera PCC 7437]